MRTRKLGKFYVTQTFFADGGNSIALFHDMVVLRAQEDFEKHAIEYIAEHPAFGEVPLGEHIPEYTATFAKDSIYPTWARSH
jgi:hypothetical protein